MSQLILTEAGGRTREIPLKNQRTAIGRHADNDIVLNDKAVSGRHAVVVTLGDGAFVEDLNSTNGTLVNGRQSAKQPLADGDTISIGRNMLRFVAADAPEPVAEALQDPIHEPALEPALSSAPVAEPEMSAPPATPAAAMAPPSQPAPPEPATLHVESGPAAGRSLPLVKELTTFGKAGLEVAGIRRQGPDYLLVKIEGPRPRINGRQIETDSQPLADGDGIEVSGTRMRFRAG